jgi:hypothetical protein
VPDEKKHLFECGAAMFLCDIGEPDRAALRLLAATYQSAFATTRNPS